MSKTYKYAGLTPELYQRLVNRRVARTVYEGSTPSLAITSQYTLEKRSLLISFHSN